LECTTDGDCGCEPGYTYYPEAAGSGHSGCCPPESYYESGHGCWNGEPGTETAEGEKTCCCDGVCGPCGERWCRDINGNCVLEDERGSNCAQGVTYCSQAACERDNPLP
jgi:hypothetical protein